MSVSVEQYLRTSFEHDAELVEGRIVERPAPYWAESRMQGFLVEQLWSASRKLGWFTMIELRVRTGSDRYRVPDVCIIRERPDEQSQGIVTRPPYLCIEIVAPDDKAAEAFRKIREYLSFGVEWVWVIDPVSLSGQVHSQSSVANVDRIFSTDRFNIDLSTVEF
jgi:Uma2 family endonuclease